MSGIRTPALGLSRIILKIGIVLNWLAAIAVMVAFAGSFVFEPGVLDYYQKHGMNGGLVMPTLRVIMLLAIPLFIAVHILLIKLLEIIKTVGDGDPFVPENAARLKAIAWCILVTQVFNLLAGGGAAVARSANADMDWDFELNGWLMVLLAFVLAKVFEEGTRIRDDLKAMI